jgi:hypothetical protein
MFPGLLHCGRGCTICILPSISSQTRSHGALEDGKLFEGRWEAVSRRAALRISRCSIPCLHPGHQGEPPFASCSDAARQFQLHNMLARDSCSRHTELRVQSEGMDIMYRPDVLRDAARCCGLRHRGSAG